MRLIGGRTHTFSIYKGRIGRGRFYELYIWFVKHVLIDVYRPVLLSYNRDNIEYIRRILYEP